MSDERGGARPGSDVDPERLAALLDGNVSDAERAKLMAELAASPDALDAFADAAAIDLELRDANKESRPDVVPIQSRARRIPRLAMWTAVAASIAAAIIIPLARRSGAVALAPVETLFAGDASGRVPLPVWSEARGANTTASLAMAIRAGAGAADLHLIPVTDDTAHAAIALRIAAMLSGVPGGGAAAQAFRDIAAAQAGPANLGGAARAAESALGQRAFRLGAWLEAARWAAAARDSTFFAPGKAKASLEAARQEATTDAMRSAVVALEAALRPSPLDWQALTSALDRTLRELGS